MLPLAGVRVAEFCQVLAGPFCGALLADMGADVIKIEAPEGDLMRAWPPMLEGYSQYFASVNRNKRSVALDLKNPDDLAAARALALSCDVVLENFRPGVMAKFGLDYATLSNTKPSLVYCSVSAFGQTGPRAKEGGFDMTVQAMSGVMSVTGEPGGRPAKCGIPIADFSAGLYAAYSVAASLAKVRGGGSGDHIDVSMLGGMLGIAHLQTSELFGTGRDPVPLGSAHPMNAPYAAFRCRDGFFALAAGTNKLWEAACEGIGRADFARDPRFATPTLRAQNQDALRELLESEFATRDACELLAIFRERGVPCAPINSYSQVLADSQVEHMGWVHDISLPNGVPTKVVASPQRVGREARHLSQSTRSGRAHVGGARRAHRGRRKAMMINAQRFRDFVREFTTLVEQSGDNESRMLGGGGKLLAALVSHDDWLPEECAKPHPQFYQQFLLHCDPLERFSVVSFVWGPGQKTPVHDHMTWGMVGIMRGAELCRRFKQGAPGSAMRASDQQRLEPGAVDLLSPLEGDIHEVANAYDDRVSISIHVYGANIGAVKRHVFDATTSEVKPFVSGYSSAFLPNFWDRSAEVRASLQT